LLSIIGDILYTGWIQKGVWLSKATSFFAQYNLIEENKNAKNKK